MRAALHAEEGGFTLVELLVAASLMLVVLGATLTTFTSFERNAAANVRQNDAQQETRRAMGQLARELRNLASPTNEQPLAVDRALPQDLAFLSIADEQPVGSANARNAQRVRYCLGPAVAGAATLYRQVQTWTTAVPPAMPADLGCPGAGWTATFSAAQQVVNASRPIFSYNAAAFVDISEIGSTLFVDVNPGQSPVESTLQTTVFLRNQNRGPVGSWSWAAGPGGTIVLNGSQSTDPEEKALTLEWWDETRGVKVGDGVVYTYAPPDPGPREMYLVAKDTANLEDRTPSQTVCVPGGQYTCP